MNEADQRTGGNGLATVSILVMLSSLGYSCDTRKRMDEHSKKMEARDKQLEEIRSKIIELAAQKK